MSFADKLIQLRKAKGLSQEDLADSLGVSRQAVSRWEQGNTFPDLPNLQKIVKVFGVSADYLICDDYAEEGHNDNAPVSEADKPQSQFDFKSNRFLIIGFIWIFGPGGKFCVSVFRQNQEYHVFNVHEGGLFPLVTSLPEGWDGMRADTA